MTDQKKDRYAVEEFNVRAHAYCDVHVMAEHEPKAQTEGVVHWSRSCKLEQANLA